MNREALRGRGGSRGDYCIVMNGREVCVTDNMNDIARAWVLTIDAVGITTAEIYWVSERGSLYRWVGRGWTLIRPWWELRPNEYPTCSFCNALGESYAGSISAPWVRFCKHHGRVYTKSNQKNRTRMLQGVLLPAKEVRDRMRLSRTTKDTTICDMPGKR
jgi:hypothetical protein